MRWYWLDRFTEFVSGERASAVKCVSLGEEYLLENFYTHPVMPNPLILEGMAQTAGMLMGESSNFRDRVVLAKISHIVYHFPARPGDVLTYSVEFEKKEPEGARIKATSHVGTRLQAEAEFYLAVLGDRFGGQQLFRPGDLGRLLRVLGVYDVGVHPDGSRLVIPDHVRDLELAIFSEPESDER